MTELAKALDSLDRARRQIKMLEDAIAWAFFHLNTAESTIAKLAALEDTTPNGSKDGPNGA